MQNLYARIGAVVAITALTVLLIPGVDDAVVPTRRALSNHLSRV